MRQRTILVEFTRYSQAAHALRCQREQLLADTCVGLSRRPSVYRQTSGDTHKHLHSVGKYWLAFPYGLVNYAAMDLLQLTPAQLRQAASLKERIAELEGELESLLGISATATPSRKLHWTQTPAGRARLARSVRRSWRTRHRSLKPTVTSPARTGKKLHWTQTPAGRAKLARSVRRSWRTRRRS